MPLLCPQEAGRLLYIGQNEWTHVNCAIWSAEVFEENDGSLKNVHAAVARGRQMVRTWAGEAGIPRVTVRTHSILQGRADLILYQMMISGTSLSILLLVLVTLIVVLGVEVGASYVLG